MTNKEVWSKEDIKKLTKNKRVSISSWTLHWWPGEAVRGQRLQRCPRECPVHSSSPWGYPSQCALSHKPFVRFGTCALQVDVKIRK